MTTALKACRFLIVLVVLGLTTSCWDRKEMDDLALVMASGLDITDDGQLEATLQIALPTGIPSAVQTGGRGQKSVIVISAKGRNASEATGKLQQQLSRIIYFGQRGVIVVGEQFARHGLDRVMDTFTRFPESRYNSYFVTAYGTTAKEILNAPYQLELIPSIGLNKILAGKVSFPIKIDDFLGAVSSEGKSPVTPAVRIVNKGTSKETFTVDRAAAYRENKLAGFLTPGELKLLRWWAGETKRMRFTVRAEPKDEQFSGIIGAELLNSSAKTRISMKNGLPEVSISLHASIRSIDNDTRLDLSKASSMVKVETLLSKHIQSEFEKMMAHAQKELKSDILGIGRETHIQHPYAWKKIKKNWFNIYPDVPVTVKADFKIERTGKTKSPAHLKVTG